MRQEKFPVPGPSPFRCHSLVVMHNDRAYHHIHLPILLHPTGPYLRMYAKYFSGYSESFSFFLSSRTTSAPKESFFASFDLSSITLQNGVTLFHDSPCAYFSYAASATMLKKIPVVSGHVFSAWNSCARSFRNVSTSTLFPFGICW